MSNLLCACLYNDYRLGKKIENGAMAVLHCLNYCINDPGDLQLLDDTRRHLFNICIVVVDRLLIDLDYFIKTAGSFSFLGSYTNENY